ncbi:MAG: hypothetical protein IKS15_05335 [Opitutales bacterium]|nr:hypothetical protein [Opitutales bacterium]
MHILKKRNIPAFRFNLDLFNFYKFTWEGDFFRIEDPVGRVFNSKDLKYLICYKGLCTIDEPLNFDHTHTELKWIKSWLNNLYFCIVKYAALQNKIRLWYPDECDFPKTYQMQVAKEFFSVPEFKFHWGYELPQKEVIVKSLTSRIFESGDCFFAKKVDGSTLDYSYPWFTQEIAKGDRDATVLYINGNVHCYQFATRRGDLTDWRVTQGTPRNKWKKWDAGKAFEKKIDAYMKAMKLKFGRLDFIIGGKEPQFLEVNPSGQFGWFDDRKFTLHNEVVDAILSKSTTIKL